MIVRYIQIFKIFMLHFDINDFDFKRQYTFRTIYRDK